MIFDKVALQCNNKYDKILFEIYEILRTLLTPNLCTESMYQLRNSNVNIAGRMIMIFVIANPEIAIHVFAVVYVSSNWDEISDSCVTIAGWLNERGNTAESTRVMELYNTAKPNISPIDSEMAIKWGAANWTIVQAMISAADSPSNKDNPNRIRWQAQGKDIKENWSKSEGQGTKSVVIADKVPIKKLYALIALDYLRLKLTPAENRERTFCFIQATEWLQGTAPTPPAKNYSFYKNPVEQKTPPKNASRVDWENKAGYNPVP